MNSFCKELCQQSKQGTCPLSLEEKISRGTALAAWAVVDTVALYGVGLAHTLHPKYTRQPAPYVLTRASLNTWREAVADCITVHQIEREPLSEVAND